MKKIFGFLDISSIGIVEKKRRIWMYEDWEFAIDSVAGLGDFVILLIIFGCM
jgi:adenylate cyclase class IV